MSRKKAGGPTQAGNARQRAAAAAQAAQRKRDRRILAIVAVGVAVLLVAGGIGFQVWRTSRTPTAGPTAPASASPTPVTLQSGQPVRFGSASAPVSMTLYEDFHCPACEAFQQSYDAVIRDALANGTLKIDFYPLQFHDTGSPPAANGFACAAQAGFGHTYYEGLFANFTLQWSDDQLISLAQQVNGSVPDTFRTCVTGKANQAWVDSITKAADANGITGTPTVLLNGQQLDLAQVTPDVLRTRITEAAAK